FHLSSAPDASGFLDQLVVVQCSNLQLFNQKVRTEARKLAKDQLEAAETRCNASMEEKARQAREQLRVSVNNRYEIKARLFSISAVSDDGIFTYIRLAKSQELSVVYAGESNDQKKLEPV